jgi:putative Mg2+ transporter-C (MgtC) family protein
VEIATFAINIAAALVMGIVIGLERQFRQHTAGLRTNALICFGAALFVSVGRMVDHESSPTRVAAQVVSGIGFLGGGVILREGLNVRGLATAATIWCSAAVGTLAGLGFLLQALIGTGAVLFVNLALRPLVGKIEARIKTMKMVDTVYRMRVLCPNDQAAVIRTVFLRHVNAQPAIDGSGHFHARHRSTGQNGRAGGDLFHGAERQVHERLGVPAQH